MTFIAFFLILDFSASSMIIVLSWYILRYVSPVHFMISPKKFCLLRGPGTNTWMRIPYFSTIGLNFSAIATAAHVFPTPVPQYMRTPLYGVLGFIKFDSNV